jgi:hypothetical protein
MRLVRRRTPIAWRQRLTELSELTRVFPNAQRSIRQTTRLARPNERVGPFGRSHSEVASARILPISCALSRQANVLVHGSRNAPT